MGFLSADENGKSRHFESDSTQAYKVKRGTAFVRWPKFSHYLAPQAGRLEPCEIGRFAVKLSSWGSLAVSHANPMI